MERNVAKTYQYIKWKNYKLLSHCAAIHLEQKLSFKKQILTFEATWLAETWTPMVPLHFDLKE